MADKQKNEIFMMPEGRVIVANAFERDVYKDPDTGAEGKPKYKFVMAYDPAQVMGEGTIEDKMADAIASAYGDTVADEWLANPRRADRISPLKDGNEIAKEREAKGKESEATKGKIVVSADSIYNKDGVEGPGGFAVYGPDCAPLSITNGAGILFPGCYGIMAVTLHAYKDYPRKGDRGLKCYLAAFQVTRSDPSMKLSTASDKSSLFKPVAGATAAPTEGVRRRRAG